MQQYRHFVLKKIDLISIVYGVRHTGCLFIILLKHVINSVSPLL